MENVLQSFVPLAVVESENTNVYCCPLGTVTVLL